MLEVELSWSLSFTPLVVTVYKPDTPKGIYSTHSYGNKRIFKLIQNIKYSKKIRFFKYSKKNKVKFVEMETATCINVRLK